MSTDSSKTDATGTGHGEDSVHSVRAKVNDTCLGQLEADGVMSDGRRKKLRALLNADKPPKADEFVSLFQEDSDEAVQ
jgi:hypothetical protein